MNNIVFLNGKFLPAAETRISIFDRGFAYGDGLFETLRSYTGRVFALDLHLQRLTEGAKIIEIPFKPNTKYLLRCINKLLELNNLTLKNTYIKLIVTRGIDYGKLMPSKLSKPTVAIIIKPLDKKIRRYQQNGMSAIFLSIRRNLPCIKSLNLLPNVIGLMEASKNKMSEGLFTDGEKILEGTISNIFAIDEKGVKTPPVEDGLLPGITRRFVIELARTAGINVQEISLTKEEFKNSREAFLTNSLMEIVPLLRVEDTLIGNGKVGTLTRKLQQVYKNMVSKRINP